MDGIYPQGGHSTRPPGQNRTKTDIDIFGVPVAVCHPCSEDALLGALSAARIKGIVSPVAGEADIFLVADLEAGNMLAKQLTYLVKADSAGVVMGARVPIILTSRADSAQARLASCAVTAAYAHSRKGGSPSQEEIQL